VFYGFGVDEKFDDARRMSMIRLRSPPRSEPPIRLQFWVFGECSPVSTDEISLSSVSYTSSLL
jgi:hypothetical protein